MFKFKNYIMLFEQFRATLTERADSKKEYFTRQRLSQTRVDTKEKSLAFALNTLMEELKPKIDRNIISVDEIKERVLQVVNNPGLSISDETRSKWVSVFTNLKSVVQFVQTAYNIILKAGGLGVY